MTLFLPMKVRQKTGTSLQPFEIKRSASFPHQEDGKAHHTRWRYAYGVCPHQYRYVNSKQKACYDRP